MRSAPSAPPCRHRSLEAAVERARRTPDAAATLAIAHRQIAHAHALRGILARERRLAAGRAA